MREDYETYLGKIIVRDGQYGCLSWAYFVAEHGQSVGYLQMRPSLGLGCLHLVI